MSYAEKAERFAKLHIKGAPFVLYNAWDAGSAKVILEAGAQAIATSSWAATRLRTLGVVRISYGALPYIDAMSALKDNASEALR